MKKEMIGNKRKMVNSHSGTMGTMMKNESGHNNSNTSNNVQHSTGSNNGHQQQQQQVNRGVVGVVGGNGVVLSKGSRFRLLEEPDEMQRKSYKKENRCLHPNPLVICKRDAKGDTSKLTDGFVTVKLVDNDGRELPGAKSACLESIDGGLTHPLDDDSSTVFSLKILQTSQGQLFRLLFSISYRTKAGLCQEEKIFSEPFGVYSNK
jgi:hypothetical protein